jgi:hypothetical protein
MKRLHTLWVAPFFGAALAVSLSPYTGPVQASTPAAESRPSPSQADAIIEAAPRSAFDKLLGPFKPSNQVEKDILAAALLDIEGQELFRAAMAGDADARARRRVIADLVNAYDAQHVSMRDTGTPFGLQWRVLSGQMQSAQAENLLPPIRELYEAKYGARDAAGRQQAAKMVAADQAAAERMRQTQAARAEAAKKAAAACGPASDGTQFDPNDINKTLRWWVARTRELGSAQRSGNQIRIDAAQQQFRRQLACLNNQRIKYTFRVQRHPIRNDPSISTAGVLVGIYHKADDGVIVVGGERDARGITYTESVPILLRAGREIDAAALPGLSTKSTFVASARVTKTGVLGATALRAPTLIVFVDDVKVERVNP